MPIKIPETGNLNQPGSTAARTSIGVGQQAAASLQGLAKAVGGAGDAFGKVALQIADANNVKHVSEVELDVEEASAQYLQSLDRDFDEENWVPGAEDLFRDLRSKVGQRDLSPAARRKIDAKMDRLEGNFLLRVGSMAANQIADRAKEASLLAAEVAAKNHDLGGYAEKIREMVESGIISPEEGDSLEFEGEGKIRSSQLQELVLTNPQGAKESVENGDWDDLPSSTRSQALYRANVQNNRDKRDYYNDLILSMESGEVPSVEQIERDKEAGLLDSGQAASMLSRINAKTPKPFDSQAWMDLNNKIIDYDPQQDDPAQSGLTALISEVASSGFTGPDMTKLRTRVERWVTGSSSAPARVMSQARREVEYLHDAEAFSDDPKESRRIQAKIYDELEAWSEQYPNAGYEEGVEEADRIVGKYRDSSKAQDILNVDLNSLAPPTPLKQKDLNAGLQELPSFDEGDESPLGGTLFDLGL